MKRARSVTAPAGALPGPAVVAIVGRPNVGKSALFNRLVGNRRALVEDTPGTTRDRVYGEVEWRGTAFRLVDTGGLEDSGAGTYAGLVRRQVEHAIREASVILFVVDAKEGLTAADQEVAELLRRAERPILLLANKAETWERRESAVQFYELGLGEPLPVSVQHGTGIADVLDMIVESLPPSEGAAPTEGLALAIVGRPNVGKSMLLNAILGEERVIVSDVPGTTRDAIDTPFEFAGQHLTLVDTAGLRRRGHITPGVERHSALRARRALERADVGLVVFDASEGVTAQDAHIAGYVVEASKGLLLVANKWDLVAASTDRAEFERAARRVLRFVPWAPLRIVSALRRTGIEGLLEEAVRVGNERRKRIDTSRLNRVLRAALADRPPPSVKGRRARVYYATQAGVAPPTFALFVNDAALVHFSYRRYLENVIRRHFGFEGAALRLVFRSKGEE